MQDALQREQTDGEQQDRQERSLARQSPRGGAVRASTVDLDDVPIYSSTGVRKIPMGKSGQYWIEIQEELDFGQQTILDNASVIGVQREQADTGAEPGQTVRLDLTRQRFLLCATWLTRWEIPLDKNKKRVNLPRHINDRVDVLKRLNPTWGDAIVAAITEHVAAKQEQEEEAQNAADEEAGIDMEGTEDTHDSPPGRSLNGASVVASSSSVSSYSQDGPSGS